MSTMYRNADPILSNCVNNYHIFLRPPNLSPQKTEVTVTFFHPTTCLTAKHQCATTLSQTCHRWWKTCRIWHYTRISNKMRMSRIPCYVVSTMIKWSKRHRLIIYIKWQSRESLSGTDYYSETPSQKGLSTESSLLPTGECRRLPPVTARHTQLILTVPAWARKSIRCHCFKIETMMKLHLIK